MTMMMAKREGKQKTRLERWRKSTMKRRNSVV
jgi:hypothetical protein